MAQSNIDNYISDAGLEAFGEKTAQSMRPSGYISGKHEAHALRSHLKALRETTTRLTSEYAGAQRLPAAVEWLLDNWYLVQREGLFAAAELQNEKKLRRCGDGALLTRLAGVLVNSGNGAVTAARLETFLLGFQRHHVLARRELCLLLSAVRCALVAELLQASQTRPNDDELASRIGRLISSLRLLGTLDLSEMLERIDVTEQTLRCDPAGIYAKMDERTRDSYRRRVSKLAKKLKTSEHRIATRVLHLAETARGDRRHVGYFLFVKPLGQTKKESNGAWYITTSVLVSLFIALFIGFLLDSALSGLVLLLPVSELVKTVIDFFALRVTPPRHIPRMELSCGIPEQGRTLCVISALLTDENSGQKLAGRLEEFRLANRDAGHNLLFGVLADLPETKNLNDGASAWVAPAANAIEGLNKKYGGGFYLLCRDRVTDKSKKRYHGWERKRGAVMSLSKLLCNQEETPERAVSVAAGNRLGLNGVRYILTLDADTVLTPGSARELVGAMLHPLNKPVFDEKRRIVVSGHAIIHPRMAVELSSAVKSGFSRIFAGQGGTDPYCGASGEVYMDLFGRGGFAGKGIIDAAALLFCMDRRIPENSVLSHDALEGAYLRGGYMGDVELTDGYPSTVSAYYKRMHRWIRGDWQNSPWLLRRGHALTDIDRWRLFDSMRRSLVAPMTFVAMLLGFLHTSLGWAAAAAVLCFASELLLTIADTLLRREQDSHVRYHSVVVHGVGGGSLRTLVRLVLLPYEAWVSLSAAALALWRMLVSHNNMLAWQTAAQTETLKNRLILSCLSDMWLPVVTGVLTAFFAPSIIGRCVGIIWALSPVCALQLSVYSKKPSLVSDADRQYLLRCAAEIWRYFEQQVTAQEHFLPPDNYQEQPPVGTAHRTSPTNIGLCLISALSAMDLGLATEHSALGVIENLLSTMERLPKWNGQLYNWYDTRTLKSLRPAYVSSVDSGNLAGCLIALREGLYALNQPGLAERANTLLQQMDFSLLYDKSRRLFRIGIDAETGKPTEGWYDLLASEARLLGFVAIAKGDVERRHWRRLGRALVQKDGYRGMASWTGTMFEYLMPELLMPCYQHSLMYESIKFCVYVQKKRTASKNFPWGVSESAFHSLDSSLSYRYKAHGCGALALKRGMDRELVVSPYSSFLALSVDPHGVVKNLKKLEELGAKGRYGFWEAVDFTPSRLIDSRPQVVRCVMAHHLGMSLVSIGNLLTDGKMQRRFMSDPAMRAHAGLLQEKVPVGGVLLSRNAQEPPEKPHRTVSEPWSKTGEGVSYLNPARAILSNGVYSVVSTECAHTRASSGEILVYRSPVRPIWGGVRIHLLQGDGKTALLPEPENLDTAKFSWKLSSHECSVTKETEKLKTTSAVAVSAAENGELRRVTLETGGEAIAAQLAVSFEPVLARESDYVNHPAFFRLGLQTIQRGDALIIRRLARGSMPEVFLCFACGAKAVFDCSGAMFSERSGRRDATLGWQCAPVVTARVSLSLKPGSPHDARFALCLGDTEDEAFNGAMRILASSEQDIASMPAASAVLLGMGTAEIGASNELLSAISAPFSHRPHATICTEGREGLWRFGVSGDLPIVCAALRSDDDLVFAQKLIKRHALLSDCKFRFDLVFISDDGGDYRRPRAGGVWDCLRRIGREDLSGIRGGVHVADNSLDTQCLISCAALFLDPQNPEITMQRQLDPTQYSFMQKPQAPPSQGYPEYSWQEGAFEFRVNRSMPPRAWGNMLTNGDFGYFATDCGSGHMWYKNARECRIGHWSGDAYAASGGESLEIIVDGVRRSLFAESSDTDCHVRYELGAAVWEKTVAGAQVRTTAFVPQSSAARIIIVECEAAAQILWHTPLVLSGDDADAACVVTSCENGVFSAKNPRSPYSEMTLRALSNAQPTKTTCDTGAWLLSEPNGEAGAGYCPCFAAVWAISGKLVIACGVESEAKLRGLATPEIALSELSKTRAHWSSRCSRLTLRTPDERLNRYLNGWAIYQTLACRLLGRSSIYQNGGAQGFRDQLQDSVNLISVAPEIAKTQLLACCEHQYEEGDVLHWWHASEDGCKGVRTRCSDDLVWLPWALCEYCEKTGDIGLCHEAAPYITSAPLLDDEREKYEAPQKTEHSESVLDHCKRALGLAASRGVGEHGLMLIGTGDWNDGFDKIGENGKGESVWLTWFFSHTARRFSKLLITLNDADAAEYEALASQYGAAANSAWDGNWYLRGYFDNGEPLGGGKSECCQIDSLSQSFSVLCKESDKARRAQGLTSAVEHLFDKKTSIVKLFTPPFLDSGKNPGYIESYGPGFRENGGQYTHGAIWLSMACLLEGRTQDGYELLRALLPENHDVEVYAAEPYVIAADVYAAPEHEGVAGWSWYTGSSGWFYRVATEDLLGLRPLNGRLHIEPQMPADWPSYAVVWQDSRGERHHIDVRRDGILVNGEPYDGKGLPL